VLFVIFYFFATLEGGKRKKEKDGEIAIFFLWKTNCEIDQMSALQFGQLFFILAHLSMHCLWKKWLQSVVIMRLCFFRFLKRARQIEQIILAQLIWHFLGYVVTRFSKIISIAIIAANAANAGTQKTKRMQNIGLL